MALGGAAALHLLAGLGASFLPGPSRASSSAAPPLLTEVELVAATPPPPPEAKAPAPPPPPLAPAARPPTARPAPAVREAPPPAAAQAGTALTRTNPEPNPTDTLVVSDAPSFAGGTTEAGGTSTHAVDDPNARAGGVEGGTGTTLGGDLSAPPRLADGVDWDCPSPEEAEDLDLAAPTVSLRIEVSAEGRVLSVTALSAPSPRFAREARRCALERRWLPGLGRAGNPIQTTCTVNVRFER